MLLEDGQGSGRTCGVNDENRLKVLAVTSTLEHHANAEEGRAFAFITQQTPTLVDPSSTSGDVCFAYLKNTNDINIILEEINIRLAGTSQSEIIKILANPTGTPVGGNTITPANLNLGSGNVADGTFLAAQEITELSGGTELHRIYVGSSNTSSTFNFGQDIIVPKNNVIGIYAETLDIEVSIVLLFNYHSPV